jgi:hypothetical protein
VHTADVPLGHETEQGGPQAVDPFAEHFDSARAKDKPTDINAKKDATKYASQHVDT